MKSKILALIFSCLLVNPLLALDLQKFNLLNWDKQTTSLVAGTALLAGGWWWLQARSQGPEVGIVDEEIEIDKTKLPFVYHEGYNIKFYGLEQLHPFDSTKYGNVVQKLKQNLNVANDAFYKPKGEIGRTDLELIHTRRYLNSLNWSWNIAWVVELFPLMFLPNFLLQKVLLKPMRLQTQGTVDAAKLALKNGVGINIGGGFHHAKANSGGGFCAYADINIAIAKLREQLNGKKILYIDLDAHRGNGVENIEADKDDIVIIDFHRYKAYPDFKYTGKGFERITPRIGNRNHLIHRNELVDLYCYKHGRDKLLNRPGPKRCRDCAKNYLVKLRVLLGYNTDDELKYRIESKDLKNIGFIFYNAGTDVFEEDPLGQMCLNKEDIVARDEMVFQFAKDHGIPICMTTSGGYTKKSADIIAESIVNLNKKGLLERSTEN